MQLLRCPFTHNTGPDTYTTSDCNGSVIALIASDAHSYTVICTTENTEPRSPGAATMSFRVTYSVPSLIIFSDGEMYILDSQGGEKTESICRIDFKKSQTPKSLLAIIGTDYLLPFCLFAASNSRQYPFLSRQLTLQDPVIYVCKVPCRHALPLAFTQHSSS